MSFSIVATFGIGRVCAIAGAVTILEILLPKKYAPYTPMAMQITATNNPNQQ
jgi:hypothetical protein